MIQFSTLIILLPRILVILNLNTVVQLFTSCRLEPQLSLAIFLFRLASTVFSVLEVLVKHNLLCLTPSFPKQPSNITAVYVGIGKGYRLWSSAVRGCWRASSYVAVGANPGFPISTAALPYEDRCLNWTVVVMMTGFFFWPFFIMFFSEGIHPSFQTFIREQ